MVAHTSSMCYLVDVRLVRILCSMFLVPFLFKKSSPRITAYSIKHWNLLWRVYTFNDRKVKHEVHAFFPEDRSNVSRHDVIVNFMRKPLVDGSDKMVVSI